MYVKFKENTGEIIGIAPRRDPDSSAIEVDLEEVKDIINGSESKRNYRVQYNAKTKELELVNVHRYKFDGVTVNDFIYEVPEQSTDDPDLTIIQDVPNSCWKILLGNHLKQNLKRQGLRLNTNLSFSITAKHDPNVLYKTVEVDFSQVANENHTVLDFTMPFEKKDTEISIFTSRKFDTYLFKRIFE